MVKEFLKAEIYFDKFGKIHVVGVRSQLAYPRPFGQDKTLRRSPKDGKEEF